MSKLMKRTLLGVSFFLVGVFLVLPACSIRSPEGEGVDYDIMPNVTIVANPMRSYDGNHYIIFDIYDTTGVLFDAGRRILYRDPICSASTSLQSGDTVEVRYENVAGATAPETPKLFVTDDRLRDCFWPFGY